MPLANFLKTLFKIDGNNDLLNSKGRIDKDILAVDQLRSDLKNVELRIEVLEYYQDRYNGNAKQNMNLTPDYRMDQVEQRLLRLRSDADKLRARIAVLKSMDNKYC